MSKPRIPKLSEKSPTRRRAKRIKPKLLALPKIGRSSQLNAEQLVERQLKVYAARIDGHKTLREIARDMDMSISTVLKDLQAVRKLKYEGLINRDEQIIEEHEERYDELISKWLALAMSEDISVEEVRTGRDGVEYTIELPKWEASKQATEVLAKLMAQRERLHGLLNPKTPLSTSAEIGATAEAIITALRKWSQPPIQAEVVENRLTEIGNGGR